MKRICLLGSTGSIGVQTLEVVRSLNRSRPRFRVVALAAGENLSRLLEQVLEFRPRWVAIKGEQDLQGLKGQLGSLAEEMELVAGEEGLARLAAESEADLVVNGLVGAVGLCPTLAAARAGKVIALANKESLVVGGHLVKEAQAAGGARLLPVDSEPSALFQLLGGLSREEVSRVLLTASGGALRDRPLKELARVTPQEVLRHPTWRMGQRITVDSATLVNKAFEVIECHWLFELSYEQIDVVLHPQSRVHGMVELVDGSVRAQLGPPDMREPIQYALSCPERPRERYGELGLGDLLLEFRRLDPKRYPAFGAVVEAGRVGGTAPAVANAADEILVERFLRGEIPFTRIATALQEVLERHEAVREPDLAEILAADRWARELAVR